MLLIIIIVIIITISLLSPSHPSSYFFLPPYLPLSHIPSPPLSTLFPPSFPLSNTPACLHTCHFEEDAQVCKYMCVCVCVCFRPAVPSLHSSVLVAIETIQHPSFSLPPSLYPSLLPSLFLYHLRCPLLFFMVLAALFPPSPPFLPSSLLPSLPPFLPPFPPSLPVI